jgi:membrane protein implicated in regulation of membrane protease activity
MACDLSIPYQGETITISRASSPQPLQPGQQVIIEAVEGLALRVSPATDRRR